jgi:hypothetical protein
MIRETNFTPQESQPKLTPEQRERINDIRIGYGIPWSMYRPQQAVFEANGKGFLYQEIAFLYEKIRGRLEDLYQKSETLSDEEVAELIDDIEASYDELTKKGEEASLIPGIQILPTLGEELVDQERTDAFRETAEEQNYVDGLFSDIQQRIEGANAILQVIPTEEMSDRVKLCLGQIDAVQDVMVDTINQYYEKNSADVEAVREIKQLYDELSQRISELETALYDEYDIKEADTARYISGDEEVVTEPLSEDAQEMPSVMVGMAAGEKIPANQGSEEVLPVVSDEFPVTDTAGESAETPTLTDVVPEEEGTFELGEEQAEFASDIEYYRMWQEGLWGVLPTREWYKGTELHETRHVIGLTLRAAGYSAEETARIFTETIDPWSEEVRAMRPRVGKEPDFETRNKLNDLKRTIIDFVRGAIASREPDLSVFARQYEVKAALPEDSSSEESVDEPAKVGETSVPEPAVVEAGEVAQIKAEAVAEEGEAVPEKSEAVVQLEVEINAAMKEWETIEKLLPESRFTLERHRARIQSESARKVLADERYPEKQKLERVGQILASLKRMIVEVRAKQGLGETPVVEVTETESTSVPTDTVESDVSVPTPAPEAVPEPSPVASEESLVADIEAFGETREDHEVLADMVEAVRVAHEEWMVLEPTLPAYAFQFERGRVDIFLSAMDSILNNEDYAGEQNIGKKIAKLGNQLEHFERMIRQIKAELGANEATTEETEGDRENPEEVTVAPAAPAIERSDDATGRQAERKRMGKETREARFKMDEANKEYNEALKQFILNQKMGASAVALYKRFNGEEVTSDLLEYLRKKADEQAEVYREKFTEWLDDREVGRILDTKYTSRSEEIYRRQQNKLVVNPYTKEQIAKEEAKAEKSEKFWSEHARLKVAKERIMKIIPKSKTGRIVASLAGASFVGAVAGTFAVGAVTGAVGGAAFAFSRGIASLGMGMGVGAVVNSLEGKKVNSSKNVLEMTLRGEGDIGSLTLEDRRKIVRLAQAKVDKAELRRTFKTRAAAITASFATRGLIGVADAVSDFSGRGAAASAARLEENPEVPAAPASAASAVETLASAASTPEPAASAAEAAAEVAAGYEAIALPRLDITELHTPNGEPLPYELRVEGAALIAGNSDLSTINAPENLYEIKGATREVIIRTLKVLLDEKPNMPKAEVERIVFEKVQAKFGSTSWWKEADIKEIRIEEINRVPLTSVPASMVAPDPERSLVEGAAVEEALPTEARRVVAETTAERRMIAEQPPQRQRVSFQETTRVRPETTGARYESSGEFRLLSRHEKLVEREVEKYYPDAKYVRVITEVPERSADGKPLSTAVTIQITTASGELVTGRGMAPVTERLSTLNLIDKAFQDIRGRAFAGFEPYKPGTGKLDVASSDPLGDFVETLNIENKTGPTVEELNEAEMTARQTSPTPTVEQVAGARQLPPAPTEHIPSGEYLKSPAYQKYLAENGVSLNELKEQVLRTVGKLESNTYKDGWEEMKYRSPYAVLKDKTLGDIKADRLSIWGNETAQRAYAAKYGFKYETLVKWADQIDYMMRDKSIPFNENTTMEDYITRHVAKMALAYKYNVDLTPVEAATEAKTAAPIVEANRIVTGRGGRIDAERIPKSGVEGYKIPAAKISDKVTGWIDSVEKGNAAIGNDHESTYSVLSGMSLRQVRDLQIAAEKNPAKFQAFVKQHDLSPVVTRKWIGLIDRLTEGRQLPKSNTTFSDWLEKRAAAVIKKEGTGLKQVNVSWSPRRR